MSKSRGNVVTPDEYVNKLGADTIRAYLMFIGPWEHGGEWDDSGISGIGRWLNRVWNLVLDKYKPKIKEKSETEKAHIELQRVTHQTIHKVTSDLERIRFNTMLAALMEFTNYLMKVKKAGNVADSAWKEAVAPLLLLLAPTAPHFTEELWQRTGREYSIHNQSWPKWDKELARDEEITLVVQVNGKLRDRFTVPVSITEAEAWQLALDSEKVKPYIGGKKIVKTIYVPSKLVNLVVR